MSLGMGGGCGGRAGHLLNRKVGGSIVGVPKILQRDSNPKLLSKASVHPDYGRV